MKNLVTLFVVWLVTPFASAEWVREQKEDPFDPLMVVSPTHEINKQKARWVVHFFAWEGSGLSDIALGHLDYSPPWCNRKGLKVKSKVDDQLKSVEVDEVRGNLIILKYAEYWYPTLRHADHWLVRVTDACGNRFDMEFDVSGTPDLRPVHPK